MSPLVRAGSTVAIRSGVASVASRKALRSMVCPRPRSPSSALTTWPRSVRSFSRSSWKSYSSACR
eukprot:9273431-Pyramimonas_sp.AAC.1